METPLIHPDVQDWSPARLVRVTLTQLLLYKTATLTHLTIHFALIFTIFVVLSINKPMNNFLSIISYIISWSFSYQSLYRDSSSLLTRQDVLHVLLKKLLVLTTTVLSQKEVNLPWNLLINLRYHPRRHYKKMKEPLSVLAMLSSCFLHVNHLAEFVVMSKIGSYR